MAMEESRQRKCMTGFITLGVLSSEGSIMRVNPFVYVDTRVAKCEITVRGEKSFEWEISRVRTRLASRSAAKRKGFRSMHTFRAMSERNP